MHLHASKWAPSMHWSIARITVRPVRPLNSCNICPPSCARRHVAPRSRRHGARRRPRGAGVRPSQPSRPQGGMLRCGRQGAERQEALAQAGRRHRRRHPSGHVRSLFHSHARNCLRRRLCWRSRRASAAARVHSETALHLPAFIRLRLGAAGDYASPAGGVYVYVYMCRYKHIILSLSLSLSHTHTHTHVYVYIHTYMHTCMHTYIHIHRGPCGRPSRPVPPWRFAIHTYVFFVRNTYTHTCTHIHRGPCGRPSTDQSPRGALSFSDGTPWLRCSA